MTSCPECGSSDMRDEALCSACLGRGGYGDSEYDIWREECFACDGTGKHDSSDTSGRYHPIPASVCGRCGRIVYKQP